MGVVQPDYIYEIAAILVVELLSSTAEIQPGYTVEISSRDFRLPLFELIGAHFVLRIIMRRRLPIHEWGEYVRTADPLIDRHDLLSPCL